MPKRLTSETLPFIECEKKPIICQDTIKMEFGSVVLLCGNSEVGKSFLALKACANAVNEGYKPFFWSIEDKYSAILERMRNISEFYPFEMSSIEFSNSSPETINSKTPKEVMTMELESLSDCNLIVLDTFSSFFTHFGFKDQNNQNDVQIFFNVLTNIATKYNQAILILHHLDKKGENVIGSSIITNVPRNVYRLEFPQGDNKTTTTYRILKTLKDSNNINDGEMEKSLKLLNNSNIDEPIIKEIATTNQNILNKDDMNDVVVVNNTSGYVTMNENRGVFYLSSKKFENTKLFKTFQANDNQINFKMANTNGTTYDINLKNTLLTQTHRSILDALFLYIKYNVDTSVIKHSQEKFYDLEVRVEPYKFLKYFLNKHPSSYGWLKEKFREISRFSYDLSYTQMVDGKEQVATQRDKNILKFDSIERIQKDNGKTLAVFVLTIRNEYIMRLSTESTLSYDDDLAKTLCNIGSLAVQDIIRFLTSFPDKKILSFKDFCSIKAYKSYKSPVIISQQKREVIKTKECLAEFGINIYGKGVPFDDYDDKMMFDKYCDSNDLIFVYQSNNKVKRFIKRGDPMNKLNIKANKYISGKLENNSLF